MWTAGFSDPKYPQRNEYMHPPIERRKPCEDQLKNTKTSATKNKKHKSFVNQEVTVKQIYQCNICGSNLQSLASYNRHSDFHKGHFKHQCTICQKGFMSSADFIGHMAKHTNFKEYGCETCGKKFAYHTSLNRHMRTVHAVK